jgi:hypothetical protein
MEEGPEVAVFFNTSSLVPKKMVVYLIKRKDNLNKIGNMGGRIRILHTAVLTLLRVELMQKLNIKFLPLEEHMTALLQTLILWTTFRKAITVCREQQNKDFFIIHEIHFYYKVLVGIILLNELLLEAFPALTHQSNWKTSYDLFP